MADMIGPKRAGARMAAVSLLAAVTLAAASAATATAGPTSAETTHATSSTNGQTAVSLGVTSTKVRVNGTAPYTALTAFDVNQAGDAAVTWLESPDANETPDPGSALSLRVRTRTSAGVWGPVSTLATGTFGQPLGHAKVAVDPSGNVIVAWRVQPGADSSSDLLVASIKLHDTDTWSPPETLCSSACDEDENLRLIVDSGVSQASVFWSSGYVLFTSTRDPSGTWSVPQTLASNGADQLMSASDSNGDQAILFHGGPGIQIVWRLAYGTWSTPKTLCTGRPSPEFSDCNIGYSVTFYKDGTLAAAWNGYNSYTYAAVKMPGHSWWIKDIYASHHDGSEPAATFNTAGNLTVLWAGHNGVDYTRQWYRTTRTWGATHYIGACCPLDRTLSPGPYRRITYTRTSGPASYSAVRQSVRRSDGTWTATMTLSSTTAGHYASMYYGGEKDYAGGHSFTVYESRVYQGGGVFSPSAIYASDVLR